MTLRHVRGLCNLMSRQSSLTFEYYRYSLSVQQSSEKEDLYLLERAFASHFSEVPWLEVSPGKFQRTIGENEAFIKLVGDPGHPLGREHWAINSIASFAVRGSLKEQELPSLFLKAWKFLRFEHPSIAAYVADDKTLEYSIPGSVSLNQWATETFHISYDKTAEDVIPELQPGPYATLIYLPKSNEMLGHTSHWRTDGIGVLLLLDAFLGLAVTPNLPDPETLPWGQEIARLAPSVEEAANIPKPPTDAIRDLGQKNVQTFFHAVGAVGIPTRANLPPCLGAHGLLAYHSAFPRQNSSRTRAK